MSETDQKTLRNAIEFMKNDSGSGTKARKQDKFREVYTENVGHIVTGERYDDAGVGPATARDAVEEVYPNVDLDAYDTISESLIGEGSGAVQSLNELVSDLDRVANLSGKEQYAELTDLLIVHAEPSLVTLALLDDESIGLGTSQMREAFFDGTRDERKRREAFVETTTEFIRLAQKDALPTSPTIGEPFDPMLAVSESRGRPENPVAQRKLDGYRIIIHIKQEEIGPKAYAFTRARNNVTSSLPELNEIDWPDQGEFILDGEVLAENGSYSDTAARVGRKAENVSRDIEMEFHVFDILVDDGTYVADEYFKQRHNKLRTFIHDVDDVKLKALSFRQGIENAKDDAVADGGEGIIVKDLYSPYEFGKRSSYWQKVKLDAETLDLKISGFHEGTGNSSDTLGSVELETSDGVYVGKSGSGFSDELCDEIWNNQDEWLGRTVEIEGRGIGTQDLIRMPIFVRSRHTDGEPDSWERVQEIMHDV